MREEGMAVGSPGGQGRESLRGMTPRACRWRLILIVLGLAALGSGAAAVAASKGPNIVFILADDMGFSDAGCYGGEIATPNLDSLAAEGLRFTQFYNSARCWPSRAAVLTGYYPQQVRRDGLPGVKVPGVAMGGSGRRPEWAPLLPVRLKPLGYRLYHSGKWHVDGNPLENGFDRSYDFADYDRFFSPREHSEDGHPLPPVPRGSGFYATTAIAERAITYLREHQERFPERPFFLYLAFIAPHFPLHALPEDIARYRGKYRGGWDEVRRQRWERVQRMDLVRATLPSLETDVGPPYHFPEALRQLGPGEVNRPFAWSGLTPLQRDFQAAKMEIHAAMVDRMDREIGRVLDQLREMKAFDDTLVFFASDNGASAEIMVRGEGHKPDAEVGSADTFLCLGPGWSSTANTPFRRHKTWDHEGGISTPLIVHWPKGISAKGELRRSPSHLIDIVPTVLDLVGIDPAAAVPGDHPALPGKSLVPELETSGAISREFLWWAHEGNRAIRMGDWKLVASGEQASWELYDLSRDRGETTDLSRVHPEKAAELAREWKRRMEEFRDDALRGTPADPN